MTQKDIIAKAHKLASKYFDVEIINFQTGISFHDNRESMELTIFYIFRDKRSNFSTRISSFMTNYSVQLLFNNLKETIQDELNEIYPDRKPEEKTVEIEIDENPA